MAGTQNLTVDFDINKKKLKAKDVFFYVLKGQYFIIFSIIEPL